MTLLTYNRMEGGGGGRGVYSAYVSDTKASDLPTPTQPTFSSPEPVVSFELGTRMRRTRVYSIVS